MSVRNKIVKGLGYIGIYLFTLVQSYLIGLLGASTVVTLVYAVWSFFGTLPSLMTERYGEIFLLSGIIPGIVVFIYTIINTAKATRKK